MSSVRSLRISKMELLSVPSQGLDSIQSLEHHAGEPIDSAYGSILAKSKNVNVVSFDVFDTVLLRDEKSELERFWDISNRFVQKHGKRLQLDAVSCLTARIQSASHAYQLSEKVQGTTEGRLADIALNMMRALRVKGDHHKLANQWSDCELEVESEQLRLSPFVDGLIDQFVRQDKTIIFLSDMYLEGERIVDLLGRSGCNMSRIDHVISTADCRINKRSGTVFSHIEKKLNLAPYDFLHLGDSLASDFKRPIEAGWLAHHLPIPQKALQARRESHFNICERVFSERNLALPMSVPAV